MGFCIASPPQNIKKGKVTEKEVHRDVKMGIQEGEDGQSAVH